jgi:hypothetical protein
MEKLPHMPPIFARFGEMGVIRDISTVKEKLQDRGQTSMFVGYASQHTGNVYRMLNIKEHRLRLSRDIQWLNQPYKDYYGVPRREDGTTLDSSLGKGKETDEDDKDISAVLNYRDGSKSKDKKEEYNSGVETGVVNETNDTSGRQFE